MTQPRAKNPGASNQGDLIALTMVSFTLLILGWMLVSIMGDTFLESMAKTSSTIASFQRHYGNLIAILIGSSLIALLVANYLYLRKPFLFFLLLAFSFTMAEALIPTLHEMVLLVRYLFMVTLIAYGIVKIAAVARQLLAVQWLSLMMLCWVLLHVLSEGVSASSAAMLPIQFTMYVGLMIGMVESVNQREKYYNILAALTWAGVVATIVHVLALLMHDQAYLSGRFRSYYVLPTNFANNYVLLVAAMLWYGMLQKSLYKSLPAFALVAIAIYLLMLSGTRNAMLAMAVAGCSLSFFWQRKYALIAGALTVLVALVAIAFDLTGESLGAAGERLTRVNEDETRFAVWARALEYIFNKPVWGYGLDVNMSQLDAKLPEWMQFDAHSAYLGLWLRLGLFGMLYIGFVYIWSGLKGLNLLFSRSVEISDRGLIILPVTLLGMLFVAGIFEENLSSKGNTQQFCMALSVGLLLAYIKHFETRVRSAKQN